MPSAETLAASARAFFNAARSRDNQAILQASADSAMLEWVKGMRARLPNWFHIAGEPQIVDSVAYVYDGEIRLLFSVRSTQDGPGCPYQNARLEISFVRRLADWKVSSVLFPPC